MSASRRGAWALRERSFDAGRVPALRLLLCAGIVFATASLAARRFEALAAQVERGAVQQLSRALGLAVDAAVLTRAARGGEAELRSLAGANPMQLLGPPPANYLGERSGDGCLEPGHWCFDLAARELVYFPEAQFGSTPGPPSDRALRLKISERASESREDLSAAGSGSLLLVATAAPAWLEGIHAGLRR